MVVATLTGLQALAQAPTNDMFASRILLEGVLAFSQTATNTLATRETDEQNHRGLDPVRSLWWRWTAPQAGYVVVNTTNSPGHTRVAVYGLEKQFPLTVEPLQTESGLPAGDLDRYEFDATPRDYNIAVDGLYGGSGVIQLDLKTYTVPKILVQPPSNASVTVSQRASLAVRALGKRPLTYQWQHSVLSPNVGYTNLPTGTARVLNIGTDGIASTADAWYYRVIIRNDYGAVTSSVARLEVNECATPDTLQPLFVSNNVGKSVSFTASGSGTLPIFYQWQFKPENQWEFVDLPGATSTNLMLTNISTDDAGDYRFLVSNIACTNQVSTNATLFVSTKNALVLDQVFPTNQTVITNFNVTNLVRVIEGYQPIRYQWWFTPDSGFPSMLVGETAPNLFLPGVRVAQAGYYWAVVTNRYAVATSHAARLNVETRPPNDNFANPSPIFPGWPNLSITNSSRTNVYGWNKNGTPEPGEKPHMGRTAQYSVWWSFQAPVVGHVIVSLNTSPAHTGVLAIYTGNVVSNLAPIQVVTNTTEMFVFVATTNVEYFVAVEASSGGYQTNNLMLDFLFNPDLGAPVFLRDLDLNLDMFILGELDGAGEGCRDFNGFVVQATSLDGVVNYQWQFGASTNGPWSDVAGQTNGTLVIANVTTANQGWYRARVSNLTASVYSHSAHLTVGIGPRITQDIQPITLSTNACSSAKFEVQAASCSPMAYQWYQNGLPVTASNATGVHSNILILTYLTPANEGTYYLTISNKNLAANSQLATLTLTNAPQIIAQPQSRTNQACTTATLSVTASANCPLTYQWFFQGNPKDGATTNSLVLAGLDATNSGNYFVVVSTPFANKISAVVSLTVRTNPVILLSPAAPQNVHACDIVNLEVQAQAEPPCSWLTYQWQLAGTNLLGATNRVYSFGAQAETAGDYRAIVSNKWTTATSAVARVAVNAQPQITKQPNPNQRAREGDSFTNQITITTCGALIYTWQFKPVGGSGFTNLALEPRFLLTTNGWLVLQNAKTNDSGYYQVVVTNIYAGVTSSVAFVRVVHPPANDNFANAFSLGGATQAVVTGYNEYATAEPGEPKHGHQPATNSVWWYWTNSLPSLVTVNLAGSDIDTTLGVYTGTSVSNLTSVAQDDDGGANGRSLVSFMAGRGKVLCFAVDGKRGAQGTNLVISVTALPINSKPVITEQPLSLAGTSGQNVTFTNRAWGSPDMVIRWFGQGTSRAFVTTNYPAATPTNYLSTLTLTNISPNDEGLYYVVLSNDFGAVTSSWATLTFGSIVRGMVSDATKTVSNSFAVGIEGVRISVGNVSTLTDSNGNYELVGVKIGDLRADFLANKTRVRLNEEVQFWNLSTETASLLVATKDGFYDYVNDHFEVGKGQSVSNRFSMSPVFKGLRFVMNWTNDPPDLDLLLHLPPSVPVDYHWIEFPLLARGSSNQPPFATLDADARSGWGPETITVHRFYPGTYGLYARKYPGYAGNTLARSAAQVVVYQGEDIIPGTSPQLRPTGTIEVPQQGTNEWWYICDIDGLTTNITWIDRFLDRDPRGNRKDQFVSAPPVAEGSRNSHAPKSDLLANVDYEWDFGDGTVSTLYEPSHAYPDPGWKTVSLNVTQTVGSPPKSASLTMTNYIYVENLPPIVAITNPAPGTIYRAGDPITLRSAADGVDDPIARVEYYLQAGTQSTYLGTATNAPYTLVFPNTNFVDSTNVFVALARDQHGATGWSDPLATVTIDLRGEILIVRNFRSAEIDEMVNDLATLRILDPGGFSSHPPVVKVLDQEGLYFGLVQDFKVIIWNDQGQIEGGLTDNDVGVLKRAYDAGIPLYLIGEKLAASRDILTDEERFMNWTDLLGSKLGGDSISPNLYMRGIKPRARDGLFYGWYPWAEAGTNILYPDSLERLSLTTNNMEVVADVPVAGSATNSPVMLRYPPFTQPDFGEARRLIQAFRVTSDQAPQSPEESQSRVDRRILFINGAAWLLRMFECQELSVNLECLQPIPSGQVGVPMTFTTLVDQNGSCTAGGVLLTNSLSPRLRIVSAEVVPLDGMSTNNYQVVLSSNSVVVRFAQLPRNSLCQLLIVAIPTRGGWLTNNCTVTRGLYHETPCAQVAYIQGTTCTAVRLSASTDKNRALHLIVRQGVGCAFQLESSTDLWVWVDSIQIEPDADPYDVTIGPASDVLRYYRLRELE